jgi:two-component system, NarL family, response regulator LiaR
MNRQYMPHLKTIRVLIADDHDMVRLGLTTFFETCNDLKVVGEARNGQEAVVLCEEIQPDVILMDVRMPVMDGIAATRIIAERYPHIAIIILTNSTGGNRSSEALDAGASLVLRKFISIDHLANAIREVVS